MVERRARVKVALERIFRRRLEITPARLSVRRNSPPICSAYVGEVTKRSLQNARLP